MANDHKQFKFTVTKAHIKKGRERNPFACPIALAVADGVCFPGFRVRVKTDKIRITSEVAVSTGEWFANSPRKVQQFIKELDKKGKKNLKPFNFVLSFNFRNHLDNTI